MNMGDTIHPKSDQLNADDLIAGPRTITITKVSPRPSTPEQPVAVHFEDDDGKPYLPGKSMRRVLVAVWGIDPKEYIGRALTLYRDPTVIFGGIQVGGIRISHMSDIKEPKTMALTTTRSSRKPFTVKPLEMRRAAQSPPPPPPAEKPRETIEPKNSIPDMNGPTLVLVNSKGTEYRFAPDKWAATFEGWFTGEKQVPFDTAATIYRDNFDNIAAAISAGYAPQAKAVEDAYAARLQANADDSVPA